MKPLAPVIGALVPLLLRPQGQKSPCPVHTVCPYGRKTQSRHALGNSRRQGKTTPKLVPAQEDGRPHYHRFADGYRPVRKSTNRNTSNGYSLFLFPHLLFPQTIRHPSKRPVSYGKSNHPYKDSGFRLSTV